MRGYIFIRWFKYSLLSIPLSLFSCPSTNQPAEVHERQASGICGRRGGGSCGSSECGNDGRVLCSASGQLRYEYRRCCCSGWLRTNQQENGFLNFLFFAKWTLPVCIPSLCFLATKSRLCTCFTRALLFVLPSITCICDRWQQQSLRSPSSQ